jgi:short-subunit dehydrogenase
MNWKNECRNTGMNHARHSPYLAEDKPMSMKGMSNKERPTALVTGGSKGIGLELAKQFARNGHDLVLVARSAADLHLAAEKLERDYGCSVTTFALDLTADHAPVELFRQLEDKGIQLDVLVNNAGGGDYGPFADSDLERQLDMLRVNILSLTALTHLFLPGMVERGSGRILNVASLAAYFSSGPNWSSYVASKHYVLAFTRGLAKELSGSGVSVTLLSPGPTATDFVRQADIGAARVVTPAGVARAGYRATMAGRFAVVPGLINKTLAFLGELPPRGIAQTVFAFLLRGKTEVKV